MADIFDLFHTIPVELGDVAKGIGVSKEVDEATIGFDTDDLSIIDIADFGNTGNVPDPIIGFVDGFIVDRVKNDTSIIVDIDLDIIVTIGNDSVDDFALRTDDFTNLLRIDVELLPLKCVRRKFFPRFWNSLKPDIQDLLAGRVRLS